MQDKSARSTAMVRFGTACEADRLVAGLPRLARIAMLAQDAGVSHLAVTIADGTVLRPATLAECTRVAPALELGEAGDGAAPLPDTLLDQTRSSWRIVRATGKAGDGLVSRWINRPVSHAISWAVLFIPGARPIHATLVAALLGLAMIAALFLGGANGPVWGALLYQAASVVDGVDGEMARATARSSAFGAALDTSVDAVTNIMFFAGLTWNLWQRGNETVALAGRLAIGEFAFGLLLLTWYNRKKGGPFSFDLLKTHYRSAYVRGPGSVIAQSLSYIISRDFYAFGFMVMILLGWAEAVIYVFAISATIWIVALAGAIPAALRRL